VAWCPADCRAGTRRGTTRAATPATRLQRVRPYLARADTGDVIERSHPHLPVADLVGARRLHDRFHDVEGVTVVDDDLDPHLRHVVDPVLGAAVHLRVTALASEPLHLGDRHALRARGKRSLLHLFELVRLDHRDHALHQASDPTVSASPIEIDSESLAMWPG